jgi:hypothetical protein
LPSESDLKKVIINLHLLSFVEAITLKNHFASEDFRNAKVKDPKNKDELKKFADSLKETDNPVLIAVTPKN